MDGTTDSGFRNVPILSNVKVGTGERASIAVPQALGLPASVWGRQIFFLELAVLLHYFNHYIKGAAFDTEQTFEVIRRKVFSLFVPHGEAKK